MQKEQKTSIKAFKSEAVRLLEEAIPNSSSSALVVLKVATFIRRKNEEQ